MPAAATRRSRQAGAHRAPQDHRPRTPRPLAPRIAQGGVVVALAVALGVVLVNPATGEGATASSSTSLTGADTAAAQAAQAARSTREKVAQVADAVTARAVAVRADGADAQVSADQLAQLDALRTQVADLVSKVQAEDAAARTDRTGVASRGGSSAERSAAPAPATSGAPASPTPSAPTTADPTSTAAALSGPSPTSSPTASAGTPTAGATPAPTAATASSAATPDATPGPTASSSTASPAPSASPSASASGSASPSASPASVDTPDQVVAAIPQVLGTDDPDAAQLRDAVIALARSTAAVSAAADANRTAAKAAADAATQQAAAAAEAAAAQAAAAAQRAAWKTSLQGYPNGKIPASALCAPTFDSGALLRCDAAEALDSLDAAYVQAFGVHLTINDSYRSYAAQVACLSTRGWLCATPGTSHHGLGIAVDLGGGIEVPGSPQHDWMVKNAATFQYEHPAWAQPDGSKPEPWHWEYTG